jgi:hypothetical protein
MGEYADMVLDGLLCEWCGVCIESSLAGEGFPQLCPECAKEGKQDGYKIVSVAPGVFQNVTPINKDPVAIPKTTKKQKIACSICGKKVAPIGLDHHIAAKHKEHS